MYKEKRRIKSMKTENLYTAIKPVIDNLPVETLCNIKLSNDIAVYLFTYRINHNLSVKQMSKLLNVKKKKILKWECESYNFTIADIVNICSRLNLTLNLCISNDKVEIKFEKNKNENI